MIVPVFPSQCDITNELGAGKLQSPKSNTATRNHRAQQLNSTIAAPSRAFVPYTGVRQVSEREQRIRLLMFSSVLDMQSTESSCR
jgi:hypothetical protein